MTEPRKFYRVNEFAAEVNVTPACVRRWILTRKIAYVKIGGRAVRIPATEVDRLVSDGLHPARTNLFDRRDGK